MANMLYNGVELPALPALPDGIDPNVWCCYAIYHKRSSNTYNLWVTKIPVTYNGSKVIASDGRIYYDCTIGSSVEWSYINATSGSSSSGTSGTFVVDWSNVDVLNSDGTLYLAASDPVDPNAPDVPELSITPLGAFLLGQQLRRNLAAVREPVAYLYNGVRLPKLPEWDKSKYPYAFIRYTLGESIAQYGLYVCSHSQIWESPDCVRTTVGTQMRACTVWAGNDAWGAFGDEYTREADTVLTDVIWANWNILDADGNEGLSASDPVPVYE